MFWKILFQGILPFGIAFLVAVLFVNIFAAGFRSENVAMLRHSTNISTYSPSGTGTSVADQGPDLWNEKPGDLAPIGSSIKGLKILSKPRPQYTDSGRANMVQGTVVLRVTFLASRQIGSIQVVKGLPDGLTEQAIKSARSIEFEPVRSDGRPTTVTKQVEYTFSIY